MPTITDKLINNTIENLEEIAKLGRPAWEAFFEKFADSEMYDEIMQWFADQSEGDE